MKRLLVAAAMVAALATAGHAHQNEIERLETYEEEITGDGLAGTVDVWVVPTVRCQTVTVTMISSVGVNDLEIIAVSRKGTDGVARCFRPATRDTINIDTAATSYSWPFCRATYDSIGINFADAAVVDLNITFVEWRD